MRLGSQERKRVRDKRGVSDGEVQRMKQRLLKVREGGKGRRQSVRTERRKERQRKRNKAVVISTKKKPPDGTMPAILCHKGLQACMPYARAGSGQERCGNNDTSRRESRCRGLFILIFLYSANENGEHSQPSSGA